MTSEMLIARPSVISFGRQAPASELYPAPVIRHPFAEQFGEPKIPAAFKSENGDIIFKAGQGWYIMAHGCNEAYKIKNTRIGSFIENDSYVKLIGTFVIDIHEQDEIVLKFDKNTGKASFGSMELTALPDHEKSRLLAATLDGNITYVGMPDMRKIESALRLPGGNYFVISANHADYGVEGLRVFTGPSLNDLHEISEHAERDEVSGTTYYHTSEGTIISPTHLNLSATPSWTPKGSHETIALETLDLKIVEQEIDNTDTRLCGADTWKDYQVKHGPTESPLTQPWTESLGPRTGRRVSPAD